MPHDFRNFGRNLLLLAHVVVALVAAFTIVLTFALPSSLWMVDEAKNALSIPLRHTAAFNLAFAGAMALLVGDGLWLLYGRRPKRPLHAVASEAPGGPIRVSREALESGLRSAGEALEVISRLRVTIEHGGLKRILIRAHFQSPEGVALREASRQLRVALAQRFQDMVQIADGAKADFELEFVGYSGRLAKKAETEPEPEEEPPFTGPKYPIADDDAGPETGRG